MKPVGAWSLVACGLCSFVACEIEDLTITEAGAGASAAAGESSNGGAHAGGKGAGTGAGAGDAGVAGDGAEPPGGSASSVEAGAGQGGAPVGGSPPVEPDGGAGGEPIAPVVCAPACKAPNSACDEGTCVPPKSCAGLEASCGASALEDCCGAIQVDGGSFLRGYDGVTFKDQSAPATVSSFALDRLEVTVGRFRKFLLDGAGTKTKPPPVGAGSVHGAPDTGWKAAWSNELVESKAKLAEVLKCQTSFQTWTDAASTNEARPINCVSWYEAQAFCIWEGGRLPTEAEWNYTASFGDKHRVYPWSSPADSSTITVDQASFWLNASVTCQGDKVSGCTLADIVVAGVKTGQSQWGHRDLAGNVSEWTLDNHQPAFTSTCIDCVETTPSLNRVVRGGGFGTASNGLLSAVRNYQAPLDRSQAIGFRCAYEGT